MLYEFQNDLQCLQVVMTANTFVWTFLCMPYSPVANAVAARVSPLLHLSSLASSLVFLYVELLCFGSCLPLSMLLLYASCMTLFSVRVSFEEMA